MPSEAPFVARRRVTDVSKEYKATKGEPAPAFITPATDKKVASIRRAAVPMKTGQLERNVDAVLGANGLSIDQTLDKAVKSLGRQPFGGKQAAPFKRKPKKGKRAKARRSKK